MRGLSNVLCPAIMLTIGLAPAAAEDKTLTVYTYESFTSEWGPGPQI